MAYAPLRKAGKFLSLPPNTLRKYADKGKINSIKNEAGQRLYDVIKDSGSGLTFKRKGLQGLLVRLMHGDKLTTVVA
ncbi:MAG: IS607 family transposase, partial [Thermosynechococcus sp.]